MVLSAERRRSSACHTWRAEHPSFRRSSWRVTKIRPVYRVALRACGAK